MAKENTQQEEMVDIGVFLKDPALVEILNGSITAYNSRPSVLEKGLRYKKTPEDSFIKANNFNAMWLIDEFLKITTKKSTLSAAQRECVNRYVVGAMQKLYRNLKKKTEEAKNGNKEESGDKGPISE